MDPLLKVRPGGLRAHVELDRDVFEAVVDEAVEAAVASWRLPRRADPQRAPASRSTAVAVFDPSIIEAMLDEILEEIAGEGMAERSLVVPQARLACSASCAGCVSCVS